MKKGLLFVLLFTASLLLGSFWVGKIFPIENEKNKEIENKNNFLKNKNKNKEKITILFVGDMMFDRWIFQTGEKSDFDFTFEKVNDFLVKKDLVVVNLEGPITKNKSVSLNSEIGSRNNYFFTFSPKIAKVLFQKNIRVVNLGNNHTLNFGEEGLKETKKYLSENGVAFFGNTGMGSEGEQEDSFLLRKAKDWKIGLVNFNQFVSNGEKQVFSDLENIKKLQPDFVVVFAHWGIEFSKEPREKEKFLAREFIDHGADLVIGTHPHVVQTKEIYNGKMIYYSLGNFIFDQYFNSETQEGLAVEVELLPNKQVNFMDYKTIIKRSGQVEIIF